MQNFQYRNSFFKSYHGLLFEISILPFKILRIDVQFQLFQGNDVEKPLDDKTSVDDDEKEPEPELKPFSMKKAYILLPAALCDMLGTSTMYVALTLTSASSFQMLRGIM